MTRTEMLKKMLDCYRSCKVMRYSDEQAFDRVLELMEEQGMRPHYTKRIVNRFGIEKDIELTFWALENGEETSE